MKLLDLFKFCHSQQMQFHTVEEAMRYVKMTAVDQLERAEIPIALRKLHRQMYAADIEYSDTLESAITKLQKRSKKNA
jgi:hypothetical protein